MVNEVRPTYLTSHREAFFPAEPAFAGPEEAGNKAFQVPFLRRQVTGWLQFCC